MELHIYSTQKILDNNSAVNWAFLIQTLKNKILF